MKRKLREIFYEIGNAIESLSMSSWDADRVYILSVKPSGSEVRHLVEEGSFREIRKNAVEGWPFTYRKFLKNLYEELQRPHTHPTLFSGVRKCNGECLEDKSEY